MNSMKNLSPFAVTIVAATLTFLMGFWLLAMPSVKEFGQSQADLEATREAIAPVVKQKEAADKLAESQALSEALLPREGDQYDLSVQIEALSKQLNVPLEAMNVTQPDAAAKSGAAAGPQKLAINVSVKAPYDKVQEFVSGLLSMSRFVQIDQVALASDPENDQSLNAQITAYAFYLSGPTVSN